jgi:hypothetical protein
VLKKNFVAACVVAAGCSAAIAAQEPQSPTPQPEAQQPAVSRDAPQPSSTVVTGCVYKEEDIPGRAPNPAERAGVLEDYILVASASEPAPRGEPAGTPGAVGTSGTAPSAMYKLEIASDEQLRAMVGKKVEVTGRVDAETGDAAGRPAAAPTSEADRAIGRDRVNLSEFEVVSIKEVAGSCPAKPSLR